MQTVRNRGWRMTEGSQSDVNKVERSGKVCEGNRWNNGRNPCCALPLLGSHTDSIKNSFPSNFDCRYSTLNATKFTNECVACFINYEYASGRKQILMLSAIHDGLCDFFLNNRVIKLGQFYYCWVHKVSTTELRISCGRI